MTWTEDRISKLKKYWQEGMTTVEIGKKLGVSKNAVVGKAHRLELDARPSPIKKEPVVTKGKMAKKAAAVVVKEKIPPKTPLVKAKEVKMPQPVKQSELFKGKLVTLMDLQACSCRWPLGDPKDSDFRFCDKEAIDGKPYCLEHCAEAYVGINKFLKSRR